MSATDLTELLGEPDSQKSLCYDSIKITLTCRRGLLTTPRAAAAGGSSWLEDLLLSRSEKES